MEELKRRILNDAIVQEGGIIQVDMFLNHYLDISLLESMGVALAKRFRGSGITKVLTVETSGIPLACFTARSAGVDAVFARRFQTGYMDHAVYSSEIHSFTVDKAYTLRVAENCLSDHDKVLIVDDILASGQAILGLLEIVAKAGAEVAGIGVAIEKEMRDGGALLRRMGLRVEALATVERVEEGRIYLK